MHGIVLCGLHAVGWASLRWYDTLLHFDIARYQWLVRASLGAMLCYDDGLLWTRDCYATTGGYCGHVLYTSRCSTIWSVSFQLREDAGGTILDYVVLP